MTSFDYGHALAAYQLDIGQMRRLTRCCTSRARHTCWRVAQWSLFAAQPHIFLDGRYRRLCFSLTFTCWCLNTSMPTPRHRPAIHADARAIKARESKLMPPPADIIDQKHINAHQHKGQRAGDAPPPGGTPFALSLLTQQCFLYLRVAPYFSINRMSY